VPLPIACKHCVRKSYLDVGGLLYYLLPNYFNYLGRAEWYELNRRSQGIMRTTEVCDYSPRTSSTIVYLIAYSNGIGEVHGPKDPYNCSQLSLTPHMRRRNSCEQPTHQTSSTPQLSSLFQTRKVIVCLSMRSPHSYKTTWSLICNLLTHKAS